MGAAQLDPANRWVSLVQQFSSRAHCANCIATDPAPRDQRSEEAVPLYLQPFKLVKKILVKAQFDIRDQANISAY